MRGDAVNKVNWPICQTQEDARADTEQPEHDSTLCARARPLLFAFVTIFLSVTQDVETVETWTQVSTGKTTGDGGEST